MSERSLPARPSLEQQKKLAKELLSAFRTDDAAARARVRRQLPDKARITLADAQYVLAREYGFASWAKLKEHIESQRGAVIPDSVLAELRRACDAGDADAARRLLQAHPAARRLINEPLFSFGSPALVHFASEGNLPLIDVLLEFGADPNQRSDWEPGPWHALHSAKGAVADRLIEAGATVDACAASHLNRLDLMRQILDADASRAHERGGDGQTPLHFARTREMVDLLLERGADPDALDVDHHATAAQWMLEHPRKGGRYELARYLVERGASADIFLAAALGLTQQLRSMLQADPALLELRTHQGEYGERPRASYHIYTWNIGQNLSPLDVAAQFEQREALEVLRGYASPTERLAAACMAGDRDDAQRLLEAHPGLLDQLSERHRRALADAGWAANARAVELMLDLGFDPAVTGNFGGSVLHGAAWEGSVACVETALRYPAVRALIEQPDPTYGGTPLSWCCHGSVHGNRSADHPGVARLLLAAGARIKPEFFDAREDVVAVFRDAGE